jgi:8-oxo-dGTP diphosphatase
METMTQKSLSAEEIKRYVLGFAFNADNDFVVLILKNKPDWQKGSFNGVGGKIETDENPAEAMQREFYEETGLLTKSREWQSVGKMIGEGWECYLFTMSDDELMNAQSITDEEVHVFPVLDVLKGNYQTISNVPFLIELCRDENRPQNVIVEYASQKKEKEDVEKLAEEATSKIDAPIEYSSEESFAWLIGHQTGFIAGYNAGTK